MWERSAAGAPWAGPSPRPWQRAPGKETGTGLGPDRDLAPAGFLRPPRPLPTRVGAVASRGAGATRVPFTPVLSRVSCFLELPLPPVVLTEFSKEAVEQLGDTSCLSLQALSHPTSGEASQDPAMLNVTPDRAPPAAPPHALTRSHHAGVLSGRVYIFSYCT